MAQRLKPRPPETPVLNLQIPQRSAPKDQSVVQIPNGYRFELNGVKMTVTSEITPSRQVLNLSIDLDSLSSRSRRK
ncbi:MAG: hypothetical protein AB1324_05485 [Candidatus Micrarchaeota archaeon]